jgi:hypothetical protein
MQSAEFIAVDDPQVRGLFACLTFPVIMRTTEKHHFAVSRTHVRGAWAGATWLILHSYCAVARTHAGIRALSGPSNAYSPPPAASAA